MLFGILNEAVFTAPLASRLHWLQGRLLLLDVRISIQRIEQGNSAGNLYPSHGTILVHFEETKPDSNSSGELLHISISEAESATPLDCLHIQYN